MGNNRMTFWASSGDWTLEVAALYYMRCNFEKRVKEKAENSRWWKTLKHTTLLAVHVGESTLALQPSTAVIWQSQFWK